MDQTQTVAGVACLAVSQPDRGFEKKDGRQQIKNLTFYPFTYQL